MPVALTPGRGLARSEWRRLADPSGRCCAEWHDRGAAAALRAGPGAPAALRSRNPGAALSCVEPPEWSCSRTGESRPSPGAHTPSNPAVEVRGVASLQRPLEAVMETRDA